MTCRKGLHDSPGKGHCRQCKSERNSKNAFRHKLFTEGVQPTVQRLYEGRNLRPDLQRQLDRAYDELAALEGAASIPDEEFPQVRDDEASKKSQSEK